jgi:neutral ceramidase
VWRRVLALGLLALAQTVATQTSSTFRAGVKQVDITPPPGFPTGGHGPAGDIARGYWNRLHARAFYIDLGAGSKGLVLVSCDLFAMPLGLHRAVWQELVKRKADAGLEEGRIILAATHTHQSPGNYTTAKVYNEFGSNESGFSQDLFDFLARRITEAIQQAKDAPQAAELHLYQAQVTPDLDKQFTMNRSPAVFSLNADRDLTLKKLNDDRTGDSKGLDCSQFKLDGEPADGWNLPGCPRLEAVDRRMSILDIQSGGKRMGTLIFFAVHPTVLVHTAPLNNSDFVGQAVDSLSREWAGGNREPVVAFFNGGEGDITPRRVRRDVLEVRDRSQRFAAAVKGVLEVPAVNVQLAPTLDVKAHLFDSTTNDTCGTATLAAAPLFGTAGVGGGEFDRTPLYDLGWKEGVHRVAQDGQGPKNPALDSAVLPDVQVTSLLARPQDFPRYFPLIWARIGSFALGAVPVEMSTTTALRIRSAVETREQPFQIIGLANEYASYTATESEYAAQDYMGASTLWGPHEAAYWQCRIEEVKNVGGEFHVPADAIRPGPPPRKSGGLALLFSWTGLFDAPFGPIYVGDRREFADDGLQEIIRDSDGLPDRGLPTYEWTETVTDKQEFDAAANRVVAVTTGAGEPFPTESSEFITVLREAPDLKKPQQRYWAAIWLRPLWDDKLGGSFQIHVQYLGGSSTSDPFEWPRKSGSGLYLIGKPVGIAPSLHKPVPDLRHHAARKQKIR